MFLYYFPPTGSVPFGNVISPTLPQPLPLSHPLIHHPLSHPLGYPGPTLIPTYFLFQLPLFSSPPFSYVFLYTLFFSDVSLLFLPVEQQNNIARIDYRIKEQHCFLFSLFVVPDFEIFYYFSVTTTTTTTCCCTKKPHNDVSPKTRVTSNIHGGQFRSSCQLYSLAKSYSLRWFHYTGK